MMILLHARPLRVLLPTTLPGLEWNPRISNTSPAARQHCTIRRKSPNSGLPIPAISGTTTMHFTQAQRLRLAVIRMSTLFKRLRGPPCGTLRTSSFKAAAAWPWTWTWCCLQKATNLSEFFFRTTLKGRRDRLDVGLLCTAAPEPGRVAPLPKNLVATNPQRVPNPKFVLPGEVAKATARTAQKYALLSSFNGPTTCRWPNCSSSRVFKDKYTLNEHLTNIHITPLCCSITGCSVGPFGKKSDLNRHISTIHGKSGFFCPIESYESKTTRFARKDKLVKHMREEHDNVRCSLNHCGTVILDGQQEFHAEGSTTSPCQSAQDESNHCFKLSIIGTNLFDQSHFSSSGSRHLSN